MGLGYTAGRFFQICTMIPGRAHPLGTRRCLPWHLTGTTPGPCVPTPHLPGSARILP
jgi:hypothetical protein